MEALSSAVLTLAACPADLSPPPCLSIRRASFPSGKDRSLSKVSIHTAGFSRSRIFAVKAAVQEVDSTKWQVIPQADRVLIRLEELPEKSVGGVLLPKSAVKFEHYLCGQVLSVGKEAGAISVGQKVLFSDLNAYEVNLGSGEKLCFVRGGDLLAVVE
uniref:Chloroplast 10 kDa chaperonin 1 n=1 Tax=Hymenophyllum caudiculatum TaxID=295381 RepID=A0A2P1JJ60_9MONI|nr:chloroplast 10 kDa chaperonin 1 [Hymenophyllum caudiculatum]